MRRDHVLAIALHSAVHSYVTEPLRELVAEVLLNDNPPWPAALSGPRYKQFPLDALQGLQKMHIFLKQILPLATHPSLPDPKISCQNKQAGT